VLPETPVDGPDEGGQRPDSYLRLLLILLVSAAFFEGYDISILALLLPNIQSTFQVSEAVLGLTRIPIELGLFAAFFVSRLADRVGRRPILCGR
jgi:MFS family permease